MKNKFLKLLPVSIATVLVIANIFLIKDIYFSKFEIGKCYKLTGKDPFNRIDYYAKVIDYKRGYALLHSISYKFVDNKFQYSFAYINSETDSFARLYKVNKCGAFDSEFNYLIGKQNEK